MTKIKAKQKINDGSKNYLWILGILIITLLIYFPSLKNNFTNWDDPAYVINNGLIRSLSFNQIKLFFTQPFNGMYQPLTLLSLAIDYSLAGLNPKLFHFTNLLFHLLNTLLVYKLVMHLFKNLKLAAFTALLFAIHPMHVESVAWITERKDVLYAFFFLLSLIFYTKYLDQKKMLFYFIALLFFVLSLLSKSQGASLAISILAIDYVKQQSFINLKTWLLKLPFLVIAFFFGYLTLQLSIGEAPSYSFLERIAIGNYGFMLYVLKLIAPFGLSAIYPMPSNDLPFIYWLSIICLPACFVLIWYFYKRSTQITFGLMFFIINIILLLQIIPNTYSLISDRYTYISSIGLFIIIGNLIFSIKVENKKYMIISLLSVYLLVLSIVAFNRTKVWKNSFLLWNDTIEKYPEIAEAWDNRGNAKFDVGYYAESVADFDQAIALKPQYADTYINRAAAKINLNNVDGALEDLAIALKLNPKSVKGLTNSGIVKDKKGDFAGALSDLNRAIMINANYADALLTRGAIKSRLGDLNGAIIDFDKTIEVNPNNATAFANRGIINGKLKKFQNAMNDFSKALELMPSFADVYSNRGYIRTEMGDYLGAINDLNMAILYNPNLAGAYMNRGVAKIKIKQYNYACKDFEMANKMGIQGALFYIQKYCMESKKNKPIDSE